jgi:carbonic anhydrase/acetyltransferase-like protein (isoleucine patch superfamily)
MATSDFTPAGADFPFLLRAPRIHPDAFVAGNATVVGDAEIGAGASLWYGVVVRGDVQPIHIGAGSNLQDGVIVHGSTGGAPVRIGAGCTIGHGAIVHGCVLDNHAFVGFGARVLDGCRIASDGMLAAGAVLTPGKTIGAGELWAGNPARLLRQLQPPEIEAQRQVAERYVAIGAAHRRLANQA